MKELLYWGVGIVAKLHDWIMQLNNAYETNFTDKELHFLSGCVVFIGEGHR